MSGDADTVREALEHMTYNGPVTRAAKAALARLEACEAQRDALVKATEELIASMTRDIHGRISGFGALRSFAAAQRLEQLLKRAAPRIGGSEETGATTARVDLPSLDTDSSLGAALAEVRGKAADRRYSDEYIGMIFRAALAEAATREGDE